MKVIIMENQLINKIIKIKHDILINLLIYYFYQKDELLFVLQKQNKIAPIISKTARTITIMIQTMLFNQ